jgi:hypothetical protein
VLNRGFNWPVPSYLISVKQFRLLNHRIYPYGLRSENKPGWRGRGVIHCGLNKMEVIPPATIDPYTCSLA